jgi:hypothetical protein
MIEIPVSPGEVLDKLVILEIKAERIDDPAKLHNVCAELALLRAKWAEIDAARKVARLAEALKRVNAALWAIEDEIRACDRHGDFGARFIDLARSVYRNNDERARLKRAVNTELGSSLVEEKSYAAY